MKNKLIMGIILMSLISTNVFAQTIKECDTDELRLRQLEIDPEYKKRREAIEEFTKRTTTLKSSTIRGIITIPVHFIVVYHTSEQNISKAQIESQIKVLNTDFRKKNPDWIKTPEEFSHLVADVEIEFVLQGIERHYTSKTIWGKNESVRLDYPNYKPETHLNIWICNLSGSKGRATDPSFPLDEDGVILDYYYVGSREHDDGKFVFPSHDAALGRTGTHEVGHWLNLEHVWMYATCDSDDKVEDTPNQGEIYYGCPTYPQKSCGSSDMFMNYMDYTSDDCQYMFTEGQKKRMRAIFEPGGPRASFITGNNSNLKSPSNLKILVNNCSVKLKWKDNSNNEEGFKIWRRIEEGKYELIKTLAANVTSYNDTDVSSEPKTYWYYIQAYNSKGQTRSSIERAIVDDCNTGSGSEPKAPNNLTLQIDDCSVKLMWKDNSDNEDGFRVRRRNVGGQFSVVKTLQANTSSYIDNTVNASTNYEYRIEAFNSKGTSNSNIQSANIETCGGSSSGITINSTVSNCNKKKKPRIIINFSVDGTHTLVTSSLGKVVNKGNGNYIIRHVNLKFNRNYTFNITVKNKKKIVATASKTVKTTSKCRKSTEEFSSNKNHPVFAVYPDPAENFLMVKGYEEDACIRIFNMTGMEVLNLEAQEMLDISNLEPGIYMIISGNMSTRFIKK